MVRGFKPSGSAVDLKHRAVLSDREDMRWYHHFGLAGALALLYPWPALNAIGGAFFGVGIVWWTLGRYYDHSLKAWWLG